MKRWYVINSDQGKSDGRPFWQERQVSLHGPRVDTSVSVAWYVFHKHGFGWGFQFGRNGGESDLGLNLYAGQLASVWLRLGTPWTKWARVTERQDPKNWYYARHTGLRIHPWGECLIAGEWDAYDGRHSSDDPWWRSWSITRTTILGRCRYETVDGASGTTRVPLPEGVYEGIWTERVSTTDHIRWPGTLRDRIMGRRTVRRVEVSVDGGIPVEGKGENSYDCGMDGVFSTSGTTVDDAVVNLVKAVLRGRSRYGGPHNLDRPMTVTEASARP